MGVGMPISNSLHEQKLSGGIQISGSTHERGLSGAIAISSHENEDGHGDATQPRSNNPNPYNFEVAEAMQIGSYVCAKVNYPDATTYEGNKVLLLGGITAEELAEINVLDPHFFHDGLVVARFRPDEEGWADAQALAELKNMRG